MRVSVVVDDVGISMERDIAAGSLIAMFPAACTASVMVTAAHMPEGRRPGEQTKALFEFLGCAVSPLSVGLHLNLTEGPALCTAAWSLQRRDKTMLGKHGFYAASDLNLLVESHIEGEIRAQLYRFRQLFGFYPERIDGHQHCHLTPLVARVICRLAPQFNLTRTRLPGHGTRASKYCKGCQRAANALQYRGVYRDAGITGGDTLIGLRWCDGNYSSAKLSQEMASARRRGSKHVEIMTHCRFLSSEFAIITEFCKINQ